MTVYFVLNGLHFFFNKILKIYYTKVFVIDEALETIK